MDLRTGTSASIWKSRSGDTHLAITDAIEELEELLVRCRGRGAETDRMALLAEVESLRRFALVRGALTGALARPGRTDGRPLGAQICELLRNMMGEVPNLLQDYSLQGARNVERDTRRVIAALVFLGRLDPEFL